MGKLIWISEGGSWVQAYMCCPHQQFQLCVPSIRMDNTSHSSLQTATPIHHRQEEEEEYVINSRERAHAVDLKLQASSLTRMKVARASAQASGPGTAVGRRELGESSSRLVRHGKRLRGSSIPNWVLAPWVLPTGRIRGHDDELLLLLLPPPIRPPQISPLLLPASSSCCNNVKTDHDPNSTASEEHKSTKLYTKQSNKQTKSISLSEQLILH